MKKVKQSEILSMISATLEFVDTEYLDEENQKKVKEIEQGIKENDSLLFKKKMQKALRNMASYEYYQEERKPRNFKKVEKELYPYRDAMNYFDFIDLKQVYQNSWKEENTQELFEKYYSMRNKTSIDVIALFIARKCIFSVELLKIKGEMADKEFVEEMKKMLVIDPTLKINFEEETLNILGESKTRCLITFYNPETLGEKLNDELISNLDATTKEMENIVAGILTYFRGKSHKIFEQIKRGIQFNICNELLRLSEDTNINKVETECNIIKKILKEMKVLSKKELEELAKEFYDKEEYMNIVFMINNCL